MLSLVLINFWCALLRILNILHPKFSIFVTSVVFIISVIHVDTATYDSQKILVEIFLTLSKLKMIRNYRGQKNSPTPDNFNLFTKLLPLLSPKAIMRSFSVVTLLLVLCLSSCKKPCNSEAIFFLLFLSSSLPFPRNKLCRHCANTLWSLLKHYPMRTVVFVR